jgi:hypothetical protein
MASSVKTFKYDIFLTHNWGRDRLNHERVVAIAAGLKAKSFKVRRRDVIRIDLTPEDLAGKVL